ncbi:MAG: 6-phosphofructokinase [Clostridiales bacterium]|nr:6-phosphofructokinase [Clostridiales bacterium]
MGKNFLYGQSGGPTSVINASFYGTIKKAYEIGSGKVYGMINGIEGFLKGKEMDMQDFYKSGEYELLKNTPASYLGTCRFKLPNDINDPVFEEIFKRFEKLDIGYVFYNGGNDSMDTTDKLSRYAAKIGSDIKVIGIPKTIDNDLILTDHTPGFGSAAKFVASTIREVVLDTRVYDKSAVTVVEIMGRHAGWLAASAVLARKYSEDNPSLIYVPEVVFSYEKFESDIAKKLEKSKAVVVALSEGVAFADGRLICEDETTQVDSFGHKSLSGSGQILCDFINKRFNIKPRQIEFSLIQRAAAKNASLTDVNEAILAGECAVEAAVKGETAKMVAFKRVSDSPYKMECTLVPAADVCNYEKNIPLEWIDATNSDIKDEYIKYATPLIEGEPELKYENGLPVFAYRK